MQIKETGEIMATISLQLNKNQIENLRHQFPAAAYKLGLPYTYFQIKLDECTITAYTSGKVVFQGNQADLYAQDYGAIPEKSDSSILSREPQAMAGSDEVGTGDYFGPVVVCACAIGADDYDWIKALGVMDSKQMNDLLIRTIAPKLQAKLAYSLLILDDETYNRVHQNDNMNVIKAKLHNQAYVHLAKKTALPKLAVVDQFMPESAYYKALKSEPTIIGGLHFETKAENKYLAVAVASVIARAAFLTAFDQLNERFAFTFPKGAGVAVDQAGHRFVQQFGAPSLNKVAKVHYKNTERILADQS